MHKAEPRPPNFNRWLQEMCERSGRPLTVAEQRRRYRRRRRLPDWAWGVLVGLTLSGVLVTAILLTR